MIAVFYLPCHKNMKNVNVILIVIDSLRPDHLGCYGYNRNTSPNIDIFSKEAILFTKAIAQSSWTAPSVASLLTSSFPGEHEMFRTITNMFGLSLNSSKSTLAELLRGNGYFTGLITDMTPLFLISGIGRGFDTFINVTFNNSKRTTEEAINWIMRNKKKKFFLFMHYFGPHFPYKPNFVNRLKEDPAKENISIPIQQSDEVFGVISKKAAENNITDLDYYIDNYDGKILYTDEQIGILLQEIKKMNLNKNTIIIIASDHGEGFGEHYLYCEHGYILYDEIIRVPLIIRFPNARFQNKIIDKPVGLADILPTILDYLKIKGGDYRGISLLPLIRDNFYEERFIYSEEPNANACIRNGRYKLIYNMRAHHSRQKYLPSSDFELYDIIEDPQEKKNLAEEAINIFNPLKERLSNIFNDLHDEKNSRMHLIPLKIDETKKESLKSLGYLQ